ncbi:MAG: sugar porter family MFS transporter [Tannerellaceae bacterium]|jgi:sugar porter (SP) family MFS transporter|nr:sugar porter family MFS transporter [Tannerellaceae bacterium]
MKSFAYIIFLSVVAALGGFLFGYDTAVISGTIRSVSAQFGLDELQTGWYVGCALMGSVIGVVFAGWLSDALGRKPVLFLSAVLFSLSAIGCMLSGSETELVIYRIAGGIGIGVASIVSPLYISEISTARYRGRLVALYQFAITVGILSSYLVNAALLKYALSAPSLPVAWLQTVFVGEYWRAMLGVGALPAFLFFMVLFFIPESPRWQIVHLQETKASLVMNRLFGKEAASRQIAEIKELLRSEVKTNWRLLWQPGFRKALFIGISLAMLGQFMGVNAVLYYGPVFFEQAGLGRDSSLDFQIVIGAINVVSTVLGMWLIDRIGRKKLIYSGVSGMIVTLALIGLYFLLQSWYSLLPELLLALIGLYIFFCAISVCTVIFVLLSEMYPAKIRGAAMSAAGLSLWIGTYLIGQLTPWLLAHLAPFGVFWLFGLMCIPYLLITWKLLPETSGRSLEEIETMLQ